LGRNCLYLFINLKPIDTQFSEVIDMTMKCVIYITHLAYIETCNNMEPSPGGRA